LKWADPIPMKPNQIPTNKGHKY